MVVADSVESGNSVRVTWRGWLIWISAALFYLYEFFIRVAPAGMASELQESFHLSAAGLGAMMGVYYFIYSPMQLLAGPLLDRFGPRQILAPAVVICTAGCLLQAMGGSSFFLGAARFCQGFGSAFAFVGAMYLAAEWFPRSMLAMLSGLTTSLGMAGAIIGETGIAAVVEHLGWRTALYAAAGLGVFVAGLIWIFVPRESAAQRARVQAVELERGPGIFKALHLVYSNPQSWLAGLAGAALYMPLSVLGALWGAEYVSAVGGIDKVSASGALSMLYVGWLIGGPLVGWYSDRIGKRRNFLLGAGVLTFLVSLVVVLVPRLPLSGYYVLMLALGFASCSQVVCFVAAVEHNRPAVAGTAIAATNMMIMLVGGVGEWLFGVLLDHFGGGSDSISAYRKAIIFLPVVAALGTVAAFFLREGFPKRKIPPGPEPMG